MSDLGELKARGCWCSMSAYDLVHDAGAPGAASSAYHDTICILGVEVDGEEGVVELDARRRQRRGHRCRSRTYTMLE